MKFFFAFLAGLMLTLDEPHFAGMFLCWAAAVWCIES